MSSKAEQAQTLRTRRNYAEDRLLQVTTMLAGIEELKAASELCIYITGSYGRLEAGPQSDLDIFFIHAGERGKSALSKVQQTLIHAEIIKGCRNLRFPEFTGGGQYLEVHYLEDMLQKLGSPEDDFKNYFTARMLLILESRPLHNPALYKSILQKVIHSYYRDYDGHESDFHPHFIVNDIVRYWKTLCLNYEMRRNEAPGDQLKRNEHHIKNLKLKFSRLFTCFSLIIPIAARKTGLSEPELLDLIQKPPLERIEELAKNERHQSLLDDYQWFLEMTSRPKDESLRWIGERDSRDSAFSRARGFGDKLFQLLKQVAQDDQTLRYIVM